MFPGLEAVASTTVWSKPTIESVVIPAANELLSESVVAAGGIAHTGQYLGSTKLSTTVRQALRHRL